MIYDNDFLTGNKLSLFLSEFNEINTHSMTSIHMASKLVLFIIVVYTNNSRTMSIDKMKKKFEKISNNEKLVKIQTHVYMEYNGQTVLWAKFFFFVKLKRQTKEFEHRKKKFLLYICSPNPHPHMNI